MTKRSLIIGLAMAVIVLVVIFLFFMPNQDKTLSPSNSTPETQSNTQPAGSDSTDVLDSELNSLEGELNTAEDINVDTVPAE